MKSESGQFESGASKRRAQSNQGQSNQRARVCAVDRLAQHDPKTLAFEAPGAIEGSFKRDVARDRGVIERAKAHPGGVDELLYGTTVVAYQGHRRHERHGLT